MTAATIPQTQSVYSPTGSVDASNQPVEPPQPHWHPATRAAFRAAFLYFGLYIISTQMLSSMILLPGLNLPDFGTKPPFRPLIIWFGQHLLGIAKPYDPSPSGSGDRMYDWVQAFTLLTLALLGAAIWSYVARHRRHHERLYRWFRTFVRLALGTTFLSYGFAKAIPLQMPAQLMRLVEPYGNMSMMGVLWSSIGSSPAYEMFTGLAEIGAGTLLLIPATARLGVLIAMMDSTAVFALNMTYDVPVKLFSFHLLVMSAVLIAPIAATLWALFILNREARIPPEPAVGETPSGRRRAVVAQMAFAFYALGVNALGAYKAWHNYGGGAPRSALYGIWDVRTMTVDGVEHPPLLTDSLRVRRAIFDNPGTVIMQRMNDQFRYLRATLDTSTHRLVLVTGPDTTKKSTLTYQRPDRGHLTLDGTLNGQPTHMELSYRNPVTFVQRSHGFSWVQEYPYNR